MHTSACNPSAPSITITSQLQVSPFQLLNGTLTHQQECSEDWLSHWHYLQKPLGNLTEFPPRGLAMIKIVITNYLANI